MLILLRFICIALMLIGVKLLFPEFKPGGRYLILLEALLVTAMAQLFRILIPKPVPFRWNRVLTALALPLTLFLVKTCFAGVNLSALGILSLYWGLLLLEIILPGRIRNGFEKNEKGKFFGNIGKDGNNG